MNNKGAQRQMYDRTRSNLLLMIIFTLLNIALFFVGSETVMLFSATLPYMSILFGIFSEIDIILNICVAFTTLVMVLYFLCWIFSKRNPVWIVIAMVMFVIDTLALIGIYLNAEEPSGILDLIIHIWILYYLFMGIKYGYKLKKMGNAEDGNLPETVEGEVYPYRADMDVKYRVLAQIDVPGYQICYRRVKCKNELVINNYVYDSVEMLIESPHELTASIDEHLFVAGYARNVSYIRIDGELKVKKFRFW